MNDPDDDFEILQKSLSPTEAYILQSRLEAEGIPALVSDAGMAQAYSLIAPAIGGVRIRVRRNYLAQAQKVMQDLSDGKYALDESDNTDEAPAPTTKDQKRLMAITRDASYLERWSKNPALVGFNAGGAVFGTLWCMFRKMYALGISCIAAILLSSWLLSMHSNTTMLTWIGITELVTRVVLALFGDFLYHQHARILISEASANITDEARLIDTLREHGGISVPAVFIYILVVIAASVIFAPILG